jgi:hypothetical protein
MLKLLTLLDLVVKVINFVVMINTYTTGLLVERQQLPFYKWKSFARGSRMNVGADS